MADIDFSQETIAAVATALGEAAIGIVRLSGPRAIAVADEIFLSKKKKSLKAAKTYTLHYGWIVKDKARAESSHPEASPACGEMIDEVLVSVMRAPSTYTRQDIVEISAHGGTRAVVGILELLLQKGVRLAEPGEFTKRAFLNGRIDLMQAEAVLDIIQAKSDLALKNSLFHLTGRSSDILRDLRRRMLGTLAQMEAAIDFPDEESDGLKTSELAAGIAAVSQTMEGLLADSVKGRLIREGLCAVIYGRPNVGKSSLLNALLRQERAIVTPIAGTTRDTIEEYVNIRGLAVRLVDTAGIVQGRDAIEREAMDRSRRAVEAGDIVLFVMDAATPLTSEDEALAKNVAQKKTLAVINKCDLGCRIDKRQVENLFGRRPLEVSAVTGQNLVQLEEAIYKSVFNGQAVRSEEGLVIAHARQRQILQRTLGWVRKSAQSLQEGLSLEFVASDFKKAQDTLGELTGEFCSPDILEEIFSRFCIGK